jgi:Na+-transporting NADH:ubiquinone oxidoreductase subunit NqrB
MASPQFKAVPYSNSADEIGIWPDTPVQAVPLCGLLTHAVGAAAASQQEELAICPDFTSLWILGVFALGFAAMFVSTARVSSSGTRVVFYVFAGLSVLMGVACLRQAWRK